MIERPLLTPEDTALEQLLNSPSGADDFIDDLYARVAQVVRKDDGSDLDLAVLVRQVLRRWQLRDGRPVPVRLAPEISRRIRPSNRVCSLRESQTNVWTAHPWAPSWLPDSEPLARPADGAAAAGTPAGARFVPEDLAADPFFTKITSRPRYLTPGQQAAVRAVVSVPDGATLIAMLPTGSGKTEVALSLADHRGDGALTLIIVPTVALAYDFERRFLEHYRRNNPRMRASVDFAWTSQTAEDARDRIKTRIQRGTQRILVTSPESMSRALREVLLMSAHAGRIGGLVIDEAHLVTQWGREFRPEFRTLAGIRDEILDAANRNGHPTPKTLLLSATLGPGELVDLHTLFASPGPCVLIAANALRAEPDIWISPSGTEEERADKVMEALAHLPRPAILYVTSPETAEAWQRRLLGVGYRRVALVTGRTSPTERSQVLTDLRTGDGSGGRVDLVIGTSAFGLGIDYPHVRTVVHACQPETVDRWYQEVGRGGRDGDVTAAVLLTAPADRGEAKNLTVTMLKDETARKRWQDLWSHRREVGDRRWFLDLEGAGRSRAGSYNRRWHAQLVQGLVELDAIRRMQVYAEDLGPLNDASGTGPQDWTRVEALRGDLHLSQFWVEHWNPWRQRELDRSTASEESMRAVASLLMSACSAIAAAYRASDESRARFGASTETTEPATPCGRCPGCRAAGIRWRPDMQPRPLQIWPVSPTGHADLADLADAAGAQDGLVLLRDSRPSLADALARSLLRRGLRHLSGAVNVQPTGKIPIFVDAHPVRASELTPYGVFVALPDGEPVPASWGITQWRTRIRSGHPVVDILLLGPSTRLTDELARQEHRILKAETALQVLGGLDERP